MKELAGGQAKELSDKAKFRLKVLDWHRNSSPRFSISGLPDASLTCRHFGIHRSMFYRWKDRFDPKRSESLENKSRRPKKRRGPGYSWELVGKVKDMRKADPTYSGKKLPAADDGGVPSVATLGRLIRRNNLFFRPDGIKQRRKRSGGAKGCTSRRAWQAGGIRHETCWA